MIGAVARNELGKRGPKPSRNGWNVWRGWTGPQLMNLGSKMEEEAQSCSELQGKWVPLAISMVSKVVVWKGILQRWRKQISLWNGCYFNMRFSFRLVSCCMWFYLFRKMHALCLEARSSSHSCRMEYGEATSCLMELEHHITSKLTQYWPRCISDW